jgi:hypothetical protein
VLHVCSLAANVRTCRSRYSDWRDYESERGEAVEIGRRTSSFPLPSRDYHFHPTLLPPRSHRRSLRTFSLRRLTITIISLHARLPLTLPLPHLFKVAAAQMIAHSYTLGSSRGRAVDVPSAAPAATAPSSRMATTRAQPGGRRGRGTRWPRVESRYFITLNRSGNARARYYYSFTPPLFVHFVSM